MKSKTYGVLAMVAVALMISVPFVQAQSRVQANVPFAFSLQDQAMPAGNYEIIALDGQVLEVWNMDARRGHFVLKQMYVKASEPASPRMVFHKYGDRYFLSQIWRGDDDYGIEFAESKLEKEVKMAGNGANRARNRDCRNEVVVAAQTRKPGRGESGFLRLRYLSGKIAILTRRGAVRAIDALEAG